MDLEETIATLVDANHILAREGVVDAFGHISVRHPDRPDRFLLSRSRSPELVAPGDIMEFTLDGEPTDAQGRAPYLERYIHGSVFKLRPDVQSVVHNHSYTVIPFGVSKAAQLRPIFHSAARIGSNIPVWDIREKFGATNMLVTDVAKGDHLAERLADNRVVLMRGHGCTVIGDSILDAVLNSIYLQVNAKLQMDAMALGDVTYMHEDEIKVILGARGSDIGNIRAWEYLKSRADRSR